MKPENTEQIDLNKLFDDVKRWADERDLLHKENMRDQMLKVNEEIGELNGAIAKNDETNIVDGIGDGFVTLIILAWQYEVPPEACLQYAYDEICDRKGTTENGVFIKEEEETKQ